MRDQWYGDNRDIVKWSVLVHLARSHKASTILQIVFYLPEPLSHELNGDGQTLRVLPEVWSHFRNVNDIGRLKSATGLDIEVFGKPFSHQTRDAYVQDAIAQIVSLKARKLVVLLDPDTGIEPSRLGPTHVAKEEVRRFYLAMKKDDVLCLYQHARRDREWPAETRDQFATALGLNPPEIKTFGANPQEDNRRGKLPRDVAILAAVKRRA